MRCNGAGPPHDHHGSGMDCTCCNASQMADLIEYVAGNESTVWGRRRIADGHPRPYQVRFFELGERRNVTKRFASVSIRTLIPD
jgi:alpha-L-arabinofuranosidase